MRGAIVYASLIEALALLPVFFLAGLSGAFFRPLALSYALAVLVSMLVALITTPALSLILLGKAPLERRESPLVGWLQRGYERLLARVVRAPVARLRRGRRSSWCSASAWCPASGRSCCPTSRSATS